MWHDVLVEQITLAEKVIRTIEDSGRQLTSSRTGWLLNIDDAIWRGHREPPRSAVYVLALSARVGLLIGALGVGRVRGGERVEDELRGGVSIGTRAISLAV